MLQKLDRTIERLTGEINTLGRYIALMEKDQVDALYKPQMEKDRVDALYKRGMAYLEKGDPQGAVADFTAVLKRAPLNAEMYYYRGVSYLHLQEWSKVRKDFARAQKMRVNVALEFVKEFGGVVIFQKDHEIELPSDLVQLLTEVSRC